MRITKRCQYALRAVFELAIRDSGQPVKIQEIAGAQNIPPRFLEVILNELRHAGFVESRRGNEGGYILARKAGALTVGEVIQYIQGPISKSIHKELKADNSQYFYGDYAFENLWENVNDAISQVCDNTTFADLVEYEKAEKPNSVSSYSI